MRKLFAAMITAFTCLAAYANAGEKVSLLHVSYDATRELFQEVNQSFSKHYKEKTGNDVELRMSHGGSGKQARAVMEGLKADVVSLALAYDIDMIGRKTGLLQENWQKTLENNSIPFTSTIVFMVRSSNPKNIKDWDDLVKEGVQVVTPNPQSSGGARWMYLSAWGYAAKKFSGDEAKVMEFMKKMYSNVPVLDAGARGSTLTFTKSGIGDVLVSWENEAILAANEIGKGKFDIIYPSLSIQAEPAIAVIPQKGRDKATLDAAAEYAKFIYTPAAQEMAAKHYFRPINAEVVAKHKDTFQKVTTFTLKEMFGSWDEAQKKHFDKGGTFDQIYGGK